MSIVWVDRNQRVPDNRRRVLAWVCTGWPTFDGSVRGSGQITRFNLSADGGSFDVERTGYVPVIRRVTHWAEINGPIESEAKP